MLQRAKGNCVKADVEMKDESEAPVKKVAAKPSGPTLKSAAGPTLKKQPVEVEEEKIEE